MCRSKFEVRFRVLLKRPPPVQSIAQWTFHFVPAIGEKYCPGWSVRYLLAYCYRIFQLQDHLRDLEKAKSIRLVRLCFRFRNVPSLVLGRYKRLAVKPRLNVSFCVGSTVWNREIRLQLRMSLFRLTEFQNALRKSVTGSETISTWINEPDRIEYRTSEQHKTFRKFHHNERN